MTKKMERNGRRSRVTPRKYSTIGGVTRQAADLKGGGLRYACFEDTQGEIPRFAQNDSLGAFLSNLLIPDP
ncbi:MAG: hypothetical protein ABSF14_18795 [Terriglobia bacterium]